MEHVLCRLMNPEGYTEVGNLGPQVVVVRVVERDALKGRIRQDIETLETQLLDASARLCNGKIDVAKIKRSNAKKTPVTLAAEIVEPAVIGTANRGGHVWIESRNRGGKQP